MATKYKILNGPGRFDLMLALFDCKEITFTVAGLGRQKCTVSELSRHNHLFGWVIIGHTYFGECGSKQFVANFDLRTNRGWISIQSNEEEDAPTLFGLHA